jgi:predicted DCC family thiol-disulfide oxidoreductase YuxK
MTDALFVACKQAVHVITPEGRVIRAGRAALFVLQEIGYPGWLVGPLAWPPLVWLVELGYRIVANNRPFFSKFLFTKE